MNTNLQNMAKYKMCKCASMCQYVPVCASTSQYVFVLVVLCCMQCLTCSLAVYLGCFHEYVRAEPGSWLVVGMIPIFDKNKSIRGGKRPLIGFQGAVRRRINLTHQCLSALMEGWNALAAGNKIIKCHGGPTVSGEGHAFCSQASS
jgi:hypothetical protein